MMEKRSTRRSEGWTQSRRAALCVAILILAVALLTASACGGGSTTTSGPATSGTTPTSDGVSTSVSGGAQVVLQGFAFSPGTVTIGVGETVTWTNQDSANHTVTADDGAFQSTDLASGDTFSFTFSAAGTYAYHCSIHPSMTGTVIVQ